MYEQRDTSVPRKHHAVCRDRGNWGPAKTINIHKEVCTFNNESRVSLLNEHDALC